MCFFFSKFLTRKKYLNIDSPASQIPRSKKYDTFAKVRREAVQKGTTKQKELILWENNIQNIQNTGKNLNNGYFFIFFFLVVHN